MTMATAAADLAKYSSYFSDAGFQVPAVEGFPVAFADIGSVSPHEAYAFARKLYFKYPNSDGICLIGSGWRVLDVVPLLEQDLQIPVVVRRRCQGLGDTKKIARQATGQRSGDVT